MFGFICILHTMLFKLCVYKGRQLFILSRVEFLGLQDKDMLYCFYHNLADGKLQITVIQGNGLSYIMCLYWLSYIRLKWFVHVHRSPKANTLKSQEL